MITYYKAYVRNGRLVLDEPTGFDEGELVELVWVEDVRNGGFDEADQAVFERELEASITEADAGDTLDFAEALTELRAKHKEIQPAGPLQRRRRCDRL